jgi:hypothetical protein
MLLRVMTKYERRSSSNRSERVTSVGVERPRCTVDEESKRR